MVYVLSNNKQKKYYQYIVKKEKIINEEQLHSFSVLSLSKQASTILE
jgi:hypothetical protein